MKYYVIVISEGDSKIAGKAIYEYDDRAMAIADFHVKLGTAMKSDLYTSMQIMVINSENGLEIKPEKWVKAPEPVEEPVTEE